MKFYWVIVFLLLLQSCKDPVSEDKKKPPLRYPPVAIIQSPINGATIYDSTIIRGLILYRGNRTVDLYIDKQLKLSAKVDTINYKWVVKDYPKFSSHTIILYTYGESEIDSFESIATVNVRVSHSMIAFSSNRDGEYELYIVNDDGTQLSKLPLINKPAFFPSWSESGERIAYIHKLQGQESIYIYRLTDSTQKLIYTTNKNIQDLTWFHHTNKLIFTEDENIVSIDTGGLNKQLLFYSYPARYPSIGKNKEIFFNYSVNNISYLAVIDSFNNIYNVSIEGSTGKLIAPRYRIGTNNLYLINLLTGQFNYGMLKSSSGFWSLTNLNTVSLTPDTLGYDFSPNGRNIVYVNKSNKSLTVASYSGGNIKSIFQAGDCINPSWSKK